MLIRWGAIWASEPAKRRECNLRIPSVQVLSSHARKRLRKGLIGALCLGLGLGVGLGLGTGNAQAETRTLSLYNTHTHERVKITFKKNGQYLKDGLREANRFLRDWRRNEMTTIDPKLLDLVWEVYQEVRATNPIYVVSSYRSPATNNMLRKRSSGVAENSQHTRGHAMDFYIPGVDLATLRATGLRKQVGGVGYYPTSGSPFVHMDTGSVRHWPRMTRSQLAKIFPDGKTLHLPSDGKPLSGYQVAMAEEKAGKLEKLNNGKTSAFTQVATAAPTPSRDTKPSALVNPATSGGGNFLASLLGNSEPAERSRVAAARADAPTPPGQIAAGRTPATASSPATAAAPALSAPPIPILKADVVPAEAPAPALITPETPALPAPAIETPTSLPFAVASATPHLKPGAAPARAEPPAPANTLDAQRQSIGSGINVAASTPVPAPAEEAPAEAEADATRFAFASILPAQKPNSALQRATEQAARTEQTRQAAVVVASAEESASEAIPNAVPPVPANGVAAIAAATGASGQARPTPAATLAYASAAADLTQGGASLRSAPQEGSARSGARATDWASASADQTVDQAATKTRSSVSGSIPRDQIVDPLAGFVSLPNKSDPKLLSAVPTKRNSQVASLQHPHQRKLNDLMQVGNRFLASGFSPFPYGAMRSERFDGPAVIVLPVRYVR